MEYEPLLPGKPKGRLRESEAATFLIFCLRFKLRQCFGDYASVLQESVVPLAGNHIEVGGVHGAHVHNLVEAAIDVGKSLVE